MTQTFWQYRVRQRVLITVCLLAALSLFLLLGGETMVPVGAWGLSFQQEGETPIGTVSSEALSGYDAVYVGNTSEPVLYLTFDAGYENGYTAQILDVLAAHRAPAAFFLVGNYLETAPELVQRMVAEGHIVGNHTYHHKNMAEISDPDAFSAELQAVEDRYREITGQELPRYYRPPQGEYSPENLAMAQEMGYKTVFWSLAYADWDNNDQPSREEAFSKLLPRIHNGAVVLLHSTSATNASILDELLTKWEDMGYRFESLDQLFAQ